MLEYAIEYLEAELDSLKYEIEKDSKFKEEYENRLPSIEMALKILQKSERQTTTEDSKQIETKALNIADVSKSCPCCDGTGYCEGEHYDDLQPCITCGGSGHVC